MARVAVSGRLRSRNFGTCLLFGSVKYVNRSSLSSISTSVLSFGAWVKFLPGNSAYPHVVSIGGDDSACIFYDPSVQTLSVKFNNIGGSSSTQTMQTGVPLNQWMHVAAVYDGSTVKGYINGTQVCTTNKSGSINYVDSSLFIGASGRSSTPNVGFEGYLIGLIDEPFVYNTNLTAAQIQDIALRGVYSAASQQVLYLFDEGSGSSTTDASGNGNTGTITSATYSYDTVMSPRFLVRDFGKCLFFNGSTAKIVKSSETAYNLTNYSIEFWAKGNPGSQLRVYTEGNSGTGNQFFAIGASSAGKVDLQIRNDSSTTLLATTSTTVAFDRVKWHHVVWTDQGGTAKVYIDGVLDATNFNYTRGTLTLNQTAIGCLKRNTEQQFYSGFLDKIRVYNSVLTLSQVQSLYYKGLAISGQVINYELDEGSGTTATDSSGNGSNGTITAATYSTDVFMKPRTAI